MIPIPDRMKHLKIDRRGYAIPISIMIDEYGVPNFTVNDLVERLRAIEHDLCGLCGRPLFRGRWFIGGPGAAFHPQGAYLDLPTHDECAHYALQACPFLAAPRYAREIAPIQRRRLEAQGALVIEDEQVVNDRPPVFVALMATGQRLIGNGQYVKPRQPYSKIEYWQHGRQLDDAEGRALSLAFKTGDATITEADIRRATR